MVRFAHVNVLLYQPHRFNPTETFIRAHAEHLPFHVDVIHGYPAEDRHGRLLRDDKARRAVRRLDRLLRGKDSSWEMTRSLFAAFRRYRPDVVLAEYGPSGVTVREACDRAKIPLVVCFHGFDASVHEVLKQHRESYPKLFQSAHAAVAVSHAMADSLRRLGAGEKVRRIPYGVDVTRFFPGDVETSAPTLVTVGRFVEKKAPYLTLASFARVLADRPAARLRMVGEGPLLGVCRDLAHAWELDHAVTFLGALPPDGVATELRNARAFVQHSIVASDGDSEGLPVAILEAGATGLATISTRHAGIPDAVVENQTGLLVDERDVAGMALAMGRLLDDPKLASRLGNAARRRVETHFSMAGHIAALATVLWEAATKKGRFPWEPPLKMVAGEGLEPPTKGL